MNEELVEKVFSAYAEKNKLNCYEMKVEAGEPSPLGSHIGGVPYFPLGADYPLNDAGKPMPIFLQINFEGVNLEGYPNRGILQVFLGECDYPTQYKVVFHQELTEYRDDVEFIQSEWVDEPIKLSFTPATSILPYYPNDMELLIEAYNSITSGKYNGEGKMELTDKENWDAIMDKASKGILGANIGGHSHTTQSEEFNYEKQKCLFKIDNYLDMRLRIGDMGIIWGMINNEDLASGNFDKTVVDWDCH